MMTKFTICYVTSNNPDFESEVRNMNELEKRDVAKIKRIALEMFEALKGEKATFEEARCIMGALRTMIDNAANDTVIR